jgi:hypothetical protein
MKPEPQKRRRGIPRQRRAPGTEIVQARLRCRDLEAIKAFAAVHGLAVAEVLRNSVARLVAPVLIQNPRGYFDAEAQQYEVQS